jgi:hypothetical protein
MYLRLSYTNIPVQQQRHISSNENQKITQPSSEKFPVGSPRWTADKKEYNTVQHWLLLLK